MTANDIVDLLLEGEADPLIRELTHAVTQEPWIKAQQAWDAEVRAGYGGNPWEVVLRVLQLPYADYWRLAQKLDTSAEDALADDNYSLDQHWNFLLGDIKHLPTEKIDAIKRLWFRSVGHEQ